MSLMALSGRAVRVPVAVLVLSACVAGHVLAQQETNPQDQPPLNVLEGRVLDHEKNPVAGARVHAVRADSGFLMYEGGDTVRSYAPDERIWWLFPKRNGRGGGSARTDEQGQFKIEGLRSGPVNILAVHPDRGIGVVPGVLQPNAAKSLDIVLTAPTFIEGRIVGLATEHRMLSGQLSARDSMPWETIDEIGGMRLYLQPRVKLSDTGEFRAGPLPAGGEWELSFAQYITKRRFAATLLSQRVSVAVGKTNRVEVDLTKQAKVTGRVLGPKGEPLENVAVAIFDPPPHETPVSPYTMPYFASKTVYGAVTDAEGNYTILGAPPGEYRMEARRHAVRTGFG